MKFESVVLLSLASHGTASSLATKPQMGWNSWNTFKSNINESIIRSTGDKLVSSGLLHAGYGYLVIDEGWQNFSRSVDGRQQANTTKFPSGIKALADSVHKQGLKLGIYSDAGIYDCGFYPGSWGYEEIDAATYADWGIDYLKYDNCGGFQAGTYSPAERFAMMGNALKNTGRQIFYSLCQWGNQFPWFWADQISDSYRMSGDIHAQFSSDSNLVCQTAYCLNNGYAGVSVLTMIRKMRELTGFQAPGSWADMDMLYVGTNAMTTIEEQTHFSFWAALKSPLIIGADITKISNASLNVLLNKEVIAINQDKAGVAATYLPALSTEKKTQIWSGPLDRGYVILALNEGTNASTSVSIPLGGIPGLKNSTNYRVRDVWAAKDLGTFRNSIAANISYHETKVYVVTAA